MAIVYTHRRNDTNDVFYVGIGKTKRRPYSYRNRNKYCLEFRNKMSISKKNNIK